HPQPPQHNCKKNYEGSSGGMEVAGVDKLFKHSLGARDVRYTRYHGDGDCKAFQTVVKEEPYGPKCKIQKLECIGFGLTVHQMRWTAYRAAEAEGINHPFSRKNEMAGFYWWVNFKKRFNLALRTPENLSLNRASMANRDLLNDFYDKTKNLMDDLNLGDKP
ncbi:hypothetical protein ANN_26558, partial [Periplaneta americana]